MIHRSAAFKLRGDVRYRMIDGEAVVVRQEQGEILALNELGSRVLELVAAGASFGAILDQLAENYETGGEDLAADVAGFLQELLDCGVTEPSG